ncbi:heme ABC transporter ATP-binding protein [Phaeobacter sp. QD34_3]|uniref:heme ABC transporter ATP-binding protein n=1 Tax=unclassified Phaeobacter TaxID=2621772 RepID=UPI00237F92E1|nr:MULTISPECIES: heme ABC transporter ATP-binding protein [unclassified Phaeobacter]MDE4133142.1 heme ABC transporter ATP-binding protein [Phaeobacter sp. QD34_3]MDE4136788.1 heme ABC transporter ATP-binding protein [Phaeobacter sp. QD34_24]MDE4173095.1 heme ABC transporter ATP-binding protein [Phaeobacter sp. PT47_59]
MQAFDITVDLGKRPILHGVDFSADAGRVTAIVGPNGSGKTTLLRAMTGEIPHSGRVLLNGLDTATLQPWELAALRAVQPQSTTIAFPFTVLEIVRLGLSAGLSAASTDLPLNALDAVDLHGFAGRYYQDLSGGEQQRVQLARVLTQVWEPVVDGTPRWLILDEPVASLDIGHQFTVMDLARRYAAAGGGVVAVMHDLNLTAMFADQVVLMQSGRVAAQGSPAEVLTDRTLAEVYGCPVPVNTTPPGDMPFLLPQARQVPVPA